MTLFLHHKNLLAIKKGTVAKIWIIVSQIGL